MPKIDFRKSGIYLNDKFLLEDKNSKDTELILSSLMVLFSDIETLYNRLIYIGISFLGIIIFGLYCLIMVQL